MEDSFQITDVSDVTLGDYINFTIEDRNGKLPAKISNSALAVLAGGGQVTNRLDVFNANREKIREAAYKSRRANPTSLVVQLSATDFPG